MNSLSKQSQWRRDNIARRLEWERKYRSSPKRRKYVAEYYKKTKAVQHAKRAARRQASPSAEYRSLRSRRPWKVLENAKRSSARKRGIPYSLSARWFKLNYLRGCAITGIPFSMGNGTICPLSATVDRIDASKNYTARNCRMVLHAVNALRGSGDDELMLRIARAIVDKSKT